MDPGSDSTRHADRSSSGRRSRRWHVRSTERRTGQLQQQQTLGISETVYVPPDEALDVERDVSVQKWKASAKSRPLKFLVAGRGGVGKSSLVNNILDSELDSSSAERAREGRTGNATTQAVCRHTGSKHGIQVIAYDTPGFQDLELAEENILAKLVDETDCMLDVCLYCASLDGMRISQEDRRICSLLTNAFKPKLWEKAIFVLTFANTVSDKVVESDYNELVDHYKNNLKGCLTKAGVPAEIVNNIPFCTAGYRDPYELKHEGCRIHWQDRLYVEIIKKADSEVTPALLKLRWGPEAVSYAMGGSVAGAVSGAAVGAGIGAGVGVFAGPVGLGIGAAVGGITGAVCGAIAGPAPATGMRALHSEDLKTIAKAKYMLWKKQQSERKKHAISHCRQQ